MNRTTSTLPTLRNFGIMAFILAVLVCSYKYDIDAQTVPVDEKINNPQEKDDLQDQPLRVQNARYPVLQKQDNVLQDRGTPLNTLYLQIQTAGGIPEQAAISEEVQEIIQNHHPGQVHLHQILDLFDYTQDWTYFGDETSYPGNFYLASTTFSELLGDSQDHAALLYAMLSTLGALSRINFDTNETYEHSYVEVNLGDLTLPEIKRVISARYPSAGPLQGIRQDPSTGQYWLNLDWTNDYPGGTYFRADAGYVMYPSLQYVSQKKIDRP